MASFVTDVLVAKTSAVEAGVGAGCLQFALEWALLVSQL
jgi:hypothetical protein